MNDRGKSRSKVFWRMVPPITTPQLCTRTHELIRESWDRADVRETDLGKASCEGIERNRVGVVRDWKGSQDRELRAQPYDTQSHTQRDLVPDVLRPRATLVKQREDTEADNDECPSDVVLGTVDVEDGHGYPGDDCEYWDRER